jgi:hypothetical protein
MEKTLVQSKVKLCREVKLPAVSMNPVQEEIMNLFPNVTLSIDIMYVNSVPFLSAISKELKIGHAVPVASRHDVVIAKALKRVIAKYERRGCSVKQLGADEEFCKLEDLVNVNFDFAAKDDHEPTIERFMRTIKDSCRSQYNMLPFKYVPKAVIRHLVLNSVFWWNALLGERGHLDTYSGHYIFTGSRMILHPTSLYSSEPINTQNWLIIDEKWVIVCNLWTMIQYLLYTFLHFRISHLGNNKQKSNTQYLIHQSSHLSSIF